MSASHVPMRLVLVPIVLAASGLAVSLAALTLALVGRRDVVVIVRHAPAQKRCSQGWGASSVAGTVDKHGRFHVTRPPVFTGCTPTRRHR